MAVSAGATVNRLAVMRRWPCHFGFMWDIQPCAKPSLATTFVLDGKAQKPEGFDMRQELREMLLQDWSELSRRMKEPYGYMPHVEAVMRHRLTPKERPEIADLLLGCELENPLYTLTGVMSIEPDPLYRDALIKSLDSENRVKQFVAMRALLRGNYKGAWEILFSRPDVQVAMRDEFPWEIWGSAGNLPESWQRRYLELFNERFKDDPPLEIRTRQWLRTLSKIAVTDDCTVSTLLRTWNRLGKMDHQDRYLLVQAMAAAPVTEYEPMLKKCASSSLPDVKQISKDGLARLKARQ